MRDKFDDEWKLCSPLHLTESRCESLVMHGLETSWTLTKGSRLKCTATMPDAGTVSPLILGGRATEGVEKGCESAGSDYFQSQSQGPHAQSEEASTNRPLNIDWEIPKKAPCVCFGK